MESRPSGCTYTRETCIVLGRVATVEQLRTRFVSCWCFCFLGSESLMLRGILCSSEKVSINILLFQLMWHSMFSSNYLSRPHLNYKRQRFGKVSLPRSRNADVLLNNNYYSRKI